METTEQKINLQLNIDGYKFFETNQSFDDDQTYSNLIQGFMDDLDYKLENMRDSEDEPVEEELELKDNLILLPNFPYIKGYLDDYKYLIIYESPKYILLQDIPNQLYDYLEQIELIPFQGYSTTYQELEYNYNYHIRYRTQRLKIQNQIEQESQQLIKNLILSNQITQIKIQF